MRRSGFALVVIALAALFAVIYFITQRQTYAESGLVLQQKFQDHSDAVSTADFDEKEELVASGGDDGLRVWRLDNAKEVFHRPAIIYKARFVKGGSLLTAGHEDGIYLYDCETWKVRRKLGPQRISSFTEASPEGDWIAASFADKGQKAKDVPTEIYVWHFRDGEWEESILRGHQGPVYFLAFLPGSPHLISGGEDWILRNWDLSSGKQIDKGDEALASKGHRVIASCALSRLLAAKSAHEYALGCETSLPKKIDVNSNAKSKVATYSPNRKWIATGHHDGTLHLLDAKTQLEIAIEKGSINRSPLNEVRFSRSGKLIVTAGDGIVPGFAAYSQKVKPDDTVVRVWRVNVPE